MLRIETRVYLCVSGGLARERALISRNWPERGNTWRDAEITRVQRERCCWYAILGGRNLRDSQFQKSQRKTNWTLSRAKTPYITREQQRCTRFYLPKTLHSDGIISQVQSSKSRNFIQSRGLTNDNAQQMIPKKRYHLPDVCIQLAKIA